MNLSTDVERPFADCMGALNQTVAKPLKKKVFLFPIKIVVRGFNPIPQASKKSVSNSEKLKE